MLTGATLLCEHPIPSGTRLVKSHAGMRMEYSGAKDKLAGIYSILTGTESSYATLAPSEV